MQSIRDIIVSFRPAHWIKNLLVLAPVFFSGMAKNDSALRISFIAFAVFCAASSAAYLFNDLVDFESDRHNARKKMRPLAAGRISRKEQIILIIVTMGIVLGASFLLPVPVRATIAGYIAVMVIYSLLLKRIWPVGIALIALGMIARVFAGALALKVPVSPWVMPSVFLLTYYVVSGKRIFDEAKNGNGNGDSNNKAGKSSRVLKTVFIICGIATLATYIFYSITDATMLKYHTHYLFVTSVPVALGLAEYARLVLLGNAKREHLEAIVLDPLISLCLLAWWCAFFVVIY